jgi:hypothetical protein
MDLDSDADPDPDPAIIISDLQEVNKNVFFSSQNSTGRNQCFLTIYA